MIYGTFLQNPFYWYLISGRQKTSFFVFLCFRDLMELKKDGDFSGVNIFARGSPGALESHEGAHEARMSTGGAAYPPGRATQAHSLVERRLGSVFLCISPSRKKTLRHIFPRIF